MPIAAAISGIVIPGFAFTSSSVWSARVPDPRGRPRRPPPLAALRARAGRAGVRRVARARRRHACARPRGARQARERSGRGLELLVLLDERLELAEAGGDLVAFFLQEVTHRYSSQSFLVADRRRPSRSR